MFLLIVDKALATLSKRVSSPLGDSVIAIQKTLGQ